MLEFVRGHYAYFFIVLLMLVGMYGMLFKANLVKKLIGLSIFQSTIILFFVASANKSQTATIPILDSAYGAAPDQYINPLPHTLMLTAIVVGVATMGVAFALLITIFRRYGSIEEDQILERMP